MKRVVFGVVLTAALLFGLIPIVGAQGVQDFTIPSFEADYYLNKDNDGRSILKTVERITAVFPETDQNHGIERAIPKKYDNHSTDLKIQSVTDEKGASLPYTTRESNDNLVLRIGDANTYVHGTKTYVIMYTQRDVTKFFEDTNDDEFYWDVNGTDWPQLIQHVGARVHVAEALMPSLNQKASCYYGAEGSTSECVINAEASGPETIFSAASGPLGPYENMTVAIGFKPHTFTPYQPSAAEKIWQTLAFIWTIVQICTLPLATGLIIWMSVRRYRVMHRVKGRGTIVPEYLPPADATVLQSGIVVRNATSDITAQLLDLAVRHYLKIYQTKEKALFQSAEYELEIVKSIDTLAAEEKALLTTLFGGSVAPRSRFAMKSLRNNYSLSRKLLDLRKKLRNDTRTVYGLFERAEGEANGFKKLGLIVLFVGIITLSPTIIVAAIIAFIFAYTLWPMTEKGVTLKEYLAGLKIYIGVAEEDRIKMLQSPEGAEKVGVTIKDGDSKKLVKLYERVLPYAVLFGIEKEWVKQLGAYYETSGTQPDWYTGNAAFNAAVFSSAVSNFSTQTSTYSSSASSSSGGSGGGGSSGGGGGGGGGGGW